MNCIFQNFFHDKGHFYQCVIKYHMLKNELLHVNKNVNISTKETQFTW